MTLLENLCKVNNQQGGTIHQFLGKNWNQLNVWNFQAEYTQIGSFLSKIDLDELAKKHKIEIYW